MRFPAALKWAAWSVLTVLLLFGAYLLAGFYLAPGFIRSEAIQWVKTNLGKPLTLGRVRLNPLSFTLDLDGIAIADAEGPVVAADHVRIGFAPLSVFASAYRFTELRLDRPFIRVVVRPDHSLNLTELAPKTHSEGPSPAVRIDLLAVNGGRIAYADRSLPGKPEETLAPITFTLKDFQTDRSRGGAFTLNARSEKGEGFGWTGTLAIAPIASRGHVTVTNLRSDTIRDFLGARIPVALNAGQIGLRAGYDFTYGKDGMWLRALVPGLTLTGLALDGGGKLFNGTVTLDRLDAVLGPVTLAARGNGIAQLTAAMTALDLKGLAVVPPGAAPAEGIRLADMALKDARLDYGAHQVTLGSLTLDGMGLFARRARNGRISLMAMLPQKTAAAPAPASTVPASTAPAPAPWKISLGSFALNGAALRLEDRAVSPMARFTIAPLTVTATGASSDLTRPVTVHFDIGFDRRGHVAGDAVVTPASLAGDLKFTVQHLPLRAFDAYMPPLKGLELRSGEAGASGTLHFKGADMAALTFRGRAAIDRFNVEETTTRSPLFAWRAFSLTGIDYRRGRVTVARARLVRPVGRVAVLADRSFNFTPLMAQKPAPNGAPGAEADTVPVRVAPAKAVPAQNAPAKPALAFQVRRLDINGGSMGFADYSIEPNFQANIDALAGTISNITNKPGAVATIDLTGQVIDRFSPVTIKGTMDLLNYARSTDMKLAFRNIELPVFNPYSGRYAGYAIAKGKLTTELSYTIQNRALKADHHIIVDQLEWGQATDSKQAVPLPVRLATALLKNADGVIDLDVPVTGSLDDPKFRIGPIIWQIIGNIIEKAVTAPFRLIGALFAGAEKARYIDFAPGSATLPQGAADALGALAKALVQKPELKLDIPAGPAIREDATGIADARIDAQLMAKDAKGGVVPAVATLDADDLHDRLEDLYESKLGKDPDFPDFTPDQLKAAPGAKPDADDDDRRTILESQWMRGKLRAAFAPTAPELAALGTARATAVRNALLADGKIDPARVFMAGDAAATAADGHSRLELKFE